jgi:hypothetical protein
MSMPGRQCFYTWRRRYDAHGLDGLRDRSHPPHISPRATRTEVVGKIIYPRQHHHVGPAKIAMYLRRYHDIQISNSGVWRILKRLELNRLPASQRHKRYDKRWKHVPPSPSATRRSAWTMVLGRLPAVYRPRPRGVRTTPASVRRRLALRAAGRQLLHPDAHRGSYDST